jgi:thiamine transport system ATP-binding protein
MSILFQDGNLFPHLTVAQNVGLALRSDLRLTAAEDARSRTLAQVGLWAWAGGGLPTCRAGSRGARPWRGCCCRTGPWCCWMSRWPRSTPGLRTEMLRLLTVAVGGAGADLRHGDARPRDAERLCDRVWLLEEGRVVLDRPVAGLREDAPEVLRDWF